MFYSGYNRYEGKANITITDSLKTCKVESTYLLIHYTILACSVYIVTSL